MSEHPHGSQTRATTGRCRCDACRATKLRYDKRRRYLLSQGGALLVDSGPSVRKLGALQALGHSWTVIGRLMEISASGVSNIMARDTIKAETALRVDEAYRLLEMKIPPKNRHTRATRTKAHQKGFAPPLAWEDIDAGVLADVGPEPYSHQRYDESLVDYVMQYHDFTPRLSPPEKAEIVRRWTRSVGSEASLCRLTGWREGRYASHKYPNPTHQEAP